MNFERRIFHHGPSPDGTPVVLSLQAVAKCWFELNRQGGCGAGELILLNDFFDRDQIEIGDWISFEFAPQERWYLGRIEERSAISPAQVRLRLQGMSIQLNEVFPGGFGEAADGVKPHRFAGNQQFSHDPDRDIETFDSVDSTTDLVQLLVEKYVVPATDIVHDPLLIEPPQQVAAVGSLKFRGEESIRSLLKELSTRAQGAAWGVDENGKFFFLKRSNQALAAFREGVNLTSLQEYRDREFLFNRILLTGDYIYDRRQQSEMIARRSYRWRGNFVEPLSRAAHGEKRIRIWLPWVRTQEDSLAFAKEFFRTYSQPTSRFLIEVDAVEVLPKPWEGRFAVYDRDGGLLTYSHAETVRVMFDHIPRVQMELGPLDPRDLWAEPPQDERWELPDKHLSAGGDVSLPPSLSVGDPPPPPPEPPQPPPPLNSESDSASSALSSLNSSHLNSSLASSGPVSSWESSGYASSGATSAIDSLSGSGGNSSLNGSSQPSSLQGTSSQLSEVSSASSESANSSLNSDSSFNSGGDSSFSSDLSSANGSSILSQSDAGSNSVVSSFGSMVSNSGNPSDQSSSVPSSDGGSQSGAGSDSANHSNSQPPNSSGSQNSNSAPSATVPPSTNGSEIDSAVTSGPTQSWNSSSQDEEPYSSHSGTTSTSY